MPSFSKLCAATALVAAVASATFTDADITAMARAGKVRIAATADDLRTARTARPGRRLANAGNDDPLHNGTVTIRYSGDAMSCVGEKWQSEAPALRCIENEDGTSTAYQCAIQAINIAKIAMYKRSVPPICDQPSEIAAQALFCDQCVKNANSTSSLDKYTRVQCLRTSTQTGARVLGCPDERCDPKHCTPLAGGLAGQCFPVGPQDAFLKSVETGGLILQAQWPTPGCQGEQGHLVFLPAASCINGYTVSCDNKI